MTKPGCLNAYVAGETLLLVPMAGWGGGFREQEEQERLAADDPALADALGRMLEASDARPGGFDRPALAPGRTGYAKAGAMARRKGVELRCFSLLREETDNLTLQLLGPVAGQRGLGPEGPAEHPRDLAETAQRIRKLIAMKN